MTIAKRQDIAPLSSISDRLLNLRRKRSLTQAEFAVRLGVPKSTYVSWERAEAEPPLRLASMIRESFGTRAAAELFGLLEEPGALPTVVDWVALGKLCREVEELTRRGDYQFQIDDVVEIAGIIFERGEHEFDQGLRDAEQLLRIGRRLPRG